MYSFTVRLSDIDSKPPKGNIKILPVYPLNSTTVFLSYPMCKLLSPVILVTDTICRGDEFHVNFFSQYAQSDEDDLRSYNELNYRIN